MAKSMKENPSSRQAEGKNAGADTDISRKARSTTVVPTSPEANVKAGFDAVKTVSRDLPSDYPETIRRSNNRARDNRTNLGRTNWSNPVTKD